MSHFEGSEDSDNRGTASVRYTLRAFVPELANTSTSFFSRSEHADTAIDIPLYNPSPHSPEPVHCQQLSHKTVIRTARLLPNHQPRTKPSLRSNIRHIFHKSHVPWLALNITFRAPSTVSLDVNPLKPLPFTIAIQRLATGVGDTVSPPCPAPNPLPKIYLKSLSLSLTAHTALRGGHDRFSGFGPKRFEVLTRPIPFFEYHAPKDARAQIQVPVVGEGGQVWQLDVGTALGVTVGHLQGAAGRVGGITTGDFLTPNVMRRWGVEWDVTLECAGEEVRWRSESVAGGGLRVRLLRGGGA
jgi:hypothetical protein